MQYPISSIYDDNHLAIPINIKEITIDDPMGGEPRQDYSYDLIIHPVANATVVFNDVEAVKAIQMGLQREKLLNNFLQEQAIIQQAGFTCSNNIKLQVDELSLARWTQLMTGLMAFSPETVDIMDYDNVIHNVTLLEARQMLSEVFAWGQAFLLETWTKKNAILAS